MNIKFASKKDIPEISKIMLDEFKKPPFNEKASVNTVQKSLDFYFKIGKVYASVIEKEIVGVLVFKIEHYWEGPVIIIEDLAVKEQFKGQKVGKMLMDKVETYAKNNKIGRIIFKTNRKSSAVKFYLSLGYILKKDVAYFDKQIK